MLATPKTGNKVNPSILAFKPRQVLLSKSDMKHNSISNNDNNNVVLNLEPNQKALLVVSIARYLERNGFSKTLKNFRSEAQIEKDDLSSSSPDLEEIYCKYLQTCDHTGLDFDKQKVQDTETDGNSEKYSKKKKRRSDDSDSGATNNKSGSTTDNAVPEVDVKSKKKKRSQNISDSLGQTEQVSPEVMNKPAGNAVSLPNLDEPDKKSKNKKKKSKLNSESLVDDDVETEKKSKDMSSSNSKNLTDFGTDVPLEDKSGKSKSKKKKRDNSEDLSGKELGKVDQGKSDKTDASTDDFKTLVDVTKKESKSSKKRKRSAFEENENQSCDPKVVEELKSGKTDGSETKESEQPTKVNASMETAECAGKESNDKIDAVANGNLEKSGEKSALQKSTKRQKNGLVEPQTNRFQRVKVEEMVFTDERLQDNSYWSKDGAENGYGAKAQEILGQVKGRGFRHEKTKKKRGTYRGGQIDLQSHSIKFQFSDDDE